MTCTECRRTLDAYLDGELDVRGMLDVESHLQACAACARAAEAKRALSAVVRERAPVFKPPPELEARLRARIASATDAAAPARSTRTSRVASWAALAVAASIALVAGVRWRSDGKNAEARLMEELVSAHLRSLQANHLVDVASSDQHTVKPWFQGRVDFGVPARALTAAGFPLQGGRIDYVAGRPVAALVYRRQQHVMNVLCWPRDSALNVAATQTRGLQIVPFATGDVDCAIVSDAALTEISQLRTLLTADAIR
ncbi:MAG TPA: zf-HC2 domain-containing protein [Polyangia bacterium]|nr:zf-HC2 domain-containing protein [Polyangia bacterium]